MAGGEFPWVYPYQEEPRTAGGHFLRKPLLRPVVRVKLVGDRPSSQFHLALVDSGADHVLAPEWMARDIGVTPDSQREIAIRIGGKSRVVRFQDVRVRLVHPDEPEGDREPHHHEWHTQVGFFMNWPDPPWLIVLGQYGFFDPCTVTMNRESAAVAITEREDFDSRFGVPIAPPPSKPPRLAP